MQEEQKEGIQEEDNIEQVDDSTREGHAIRFVVLGIPYSIRPSDELSAEDIEVLITYVKSLIESYTQKGYDETKIPILVAFDIANELRELQKFYELPINRAIDKLKFVLEPE